MKTTKAPKKAPSSRTLRRQFLAAQKVAQTTSEPLPPLRDQDYIDLRQKLNYLDSSTGALVSASEEVDKCRAELIAAETALKQAEEELRAVKEEHQAALRDIAPLLNRLPTV
jgi:uncharacterized protein (DUF3084 family)